jgi:hypothetical protein
MKKLILILAVIISSCSNDSENRTEPQNCNCNTIISANTFSIPGRTWTVATTANDCSGLQSQIELNGVHFVGEKICN